MGSAAWSLLVTEMYNCTYLERWLISCSSVQYETGKQNAMPLEWRETDRCHYLQILRQICTVYSELKMQRMEFAPQSRGLEFLETGA